MELGFTKPKKNKNSVTGQTKHRLSLRLIGDSEGRLSLVNGLNLYPGPGLPSVNQ